MYLSIAAAATSSGNTHACRVAAQAYAYLLSRQTTQLLLCESYVRGVDSSGHAGTGTSAHFWAALIWILHRSCMQGKYDMPLARDSQKILQ